MKRNQYLVCYEKGFISILHRSTKSKCIEEGVKLMKRLKASEQSIAFFKQTERWFNEADDIVLRITEFNG